MDRATIKKLKSYPIEVGSFDGKEYPLTDLPTQFLLNVQEELRERGFGLLPNREVNGVSVTGGNFIMQHHDYSVVSHADDVQNGLCFAIIPFSTKKITKANVSIVSAMEFHYANADKKCVTTNLVVGQMVIFDPSKKHSLIYYGYDVKLMMFSVEKTNV